MSSSPSDSPAPAHGSGSRWGGFSRELPFLVMLLLSFAGIAYTTFAPQSSALYWEILVPIFAAGCIATGWPRAHATREHWRLLWTQILHWGAFLGAMQLMFLPGVQRLMNAGAHGLSVLILLALGTFVAGVHAQSWQIGLVGLVLALGVSAVVWIEQSALLILVAIAALVALALGLRFVVVRLRATLASSPAAPPARGRT